MKITLLIFFYTIVFVLFGTLALAFALHLLTLNDVVMQLTQAYNDMQMRIATALGGLVFILSGLSAMQAITGKIQRERTIAFSNPNGQVTITLSAVEDLIKRLANQLSELKDARADVKASKRGIDVHMRVSVRAETNIPDFTAKLQGLIANKIQEVFGIEEAINVKIHVAKIVPHDEKRKKNIEKIQQDEDVNIPYQAINL
jgi:uncharacterized alkaline shock family protein YloU